MRQMKVKRHYRLPSGKELTVGEGRSSWAY